VCPPGFPSAELPAISGCSAWPSTARASGLHRRWCFLGGFALLLALGLDSRLSGLPSDQFGFARASSSRSASCSASTSGGADPSAPRQRGFALDEDALLAHLDLDGAAGGIGLSISLVCLRVSLILVLASLVPCTRRELEQLRLVLLSEHRVLELLATPAAWSCSSSIVAGTPSSFAN
jgi:hypothetical protein